MMGNPTAKQRREWQARITALPTQADIEDCKALWPHDWREKHAFFDGQVAALVHEQARLREQLEAAWRANERLDAENDWLRAYKGVPASEADANTAELRKKPKGEDTLYTPAWGHKRAAQVRKAREARADGSER